MRDVPSLHGNLNGRMGHPAFLCLAGAMTVLAGALVVHFMCACADFLAAVRYPLEMDYGEGIVWQQLVRIPGPTMYRTIAESPYIVFHYPPVFYLATHAMQALVPSPLAAGRAVSCVSALLIMPSVAGIVLMAARRPGHRAGWREVTIALGCAALVVSLHPVRAWAVLMRVDTLGYALAMAGLALGIRADGRFFGTLLALLLCVGAVFSKQTLVAAGVAVFIAAVVRRPRAGFAAGMVAALAALAALLVLQRATDGGFLANIVGNNINRFALRNLPRVLRDEWSSLAPMLLMLLAGAWVAREVLPSLLHRRSQPLVSGMVRDLVALRYAGPAQAARATLLLHFVVCTATLVTLFKSGGTYNYLNEWMCSGCALLGVLTIDLVRAPALHKGLLGVFLGAAAAVLLLPYRLVPDHAGQALLEDNAKLVARIAAAERPVLSDYMSLILMAGKTVYAEPAIVTELAVTGRWDEAPYVQKIRDKGFAFILTWDNKSGLTERRSEAVNAAIHEAYPRVSLVRRGMWLWETE